MWEVDQGGMKLFGTLGRSKKTIAMLRERCWPQTAKPEGDKMCKVFV